MSDASKIVLLHLLDMGVVDKTRVTKHHFFTDCLYKAKYLIFPNKKIISKGYKKGY